ncbi:Lnb N-terminal periplasmic domain-containing protein [Kushneria sp. EE4]
MPSPARRWWHPLLRWTWRSLAALFVVLATLWGTLALWYQLPGPVALVVTVMTGWALLGLAAVLATLGVFDARRRPRAIPWAWLAASMVLLLWWQTITPHGDLDWADDMAHLPRAEIEGDRVTIDNVRHFDWQTRERYTQRWETRTYDLSELESTDLLVSYWMGPAIAHTLVSFGFRDGRQLVFSVEIRRQRGEAFSAIGGFFKQFELALIAADEHDIVRTRSNVREEEVYLYRVALPEAAARQLFLAYLDEADALRDTPAFYNTLTSNCTTLVFDMVKRIIPGLPGDYRLLLSGYLPDYLFDLDALDTSRSLLELKSRGHINSRARAADNGGHALPDFSAAIRQGVPAPDGHLIDTGTPNE